MFSLIGNQRVGIFPSKSKILFYLSLALIWCQNFQDRTIPVGGDTWTSFGGKKKKNNNEKETYGESVCEAVRNKIAMEGKPSNRTGHATIRWLSNKVFPTFQAIWENFRQKVAQRSRDSGRRSRDRRQTVKQRFFDVSSNSVTILENFCEKSHWTVTRQWSEVTRPSADCQTTFLDVSSNLENFWKKSLNGHATVVGGHATVGRLSNNVFWTFQAFRKTFEKSRWTVTRQWSEVTRPSADCQTTFFRRFKQLGKIFEKSHWTVTRQWSEVTRPSADCQTTFFGRFKQLGNFLKKVAERSRDSGRRSRDRWPTVKQRFFGRFKQFGKIFEKSRWTVIDSGRRSRDRRPTVKNVFCVGQA